MISLEESNAGALTPIVVKWAVPATVGRVALATTSHYIDAIVQWESVIGLAICGIFGAMYAGSVRRSLGDAVWHGGMVAGIAAFLGTAVAVTLADRSMSDLLWGTVWAFGVGAVAGAVVHLSPMGSSPWRPSAGRPTG